MDIKSQPLKTRVLALTGLFETSLGFPGCFGVSVGNFDGQGMSFGVLQWNLGQGTLQPILIGLWTQHKEIMEKCFPVPALDELIGMMSKPRIAQITWANSRTKGRSLITCLRDSFMDLGSTPECQAYQLKAADWYFQKAQRLYVQLGLCSERGFALCFDIAVQNGGINKKTELAIWNGFKTVTDEQGKLETIAWYVAKAANPQWFNDVLSRKQAIAKGSGKVHGLSVNLEDYGLTISPIKG